MSRRLMLICHIICLLLMLVASADAQTIAFNNFGPGDSYDPVGAWGIANNAGGHTYTFGARFVPTATGSVSDIWLPAELSGGSNNLEVALMSDSGGQPGSVMETWSFINELNGISSTILHGIGVGTTQITAGQTYWLVASAPVSGTFASWNQTSPVVYGTYAFSTTVGFGGPWLIETDEVEPAFRVAVNAPPQAVPTMTEWGMTIFVALAGFVSIVYLRKQRREI